MAKVIAEIGSVHDGSFGNAIKLIEAVALTKAYGVKFQMHIAEAETLRSAPSPSYFNSESRYDYFIRTSFSEAQWIELYVAAKKNNLAFWVSPFSLEAVDILEKTGVDGYKIASGEVTNIPLLQKIAATNKPVMLSSGMSSWLELDAAVVVLRNTDLTILQCSSIYPCPPEKVGLNVLNEMRERYQLPVGFSDHTQGVSAAAAMVAHGAEIVEKHFTFSKLMYGSDAANAMEPNDFSRFVAVVDEVAAILRSPIDKDDLSGYREMKTVFEKSIVAARDLSEGDVLVINDLAFKKPGGGISASQYHEILGKKLKRSIQRNSLLQEEDVV